MKNHEKEKARERKREREREREREKERGSKAKTVTDKSIPVTRLFSLVTNEHLKTYPIRHPL